MSELQVIVNQTPGTIGWNFEELKQNLSAEMEKYQNIIYTDDNIKDAKADVAGLRKLQKEVDSRRIEIKKACLLPYETFEAQAKELVAIIEKPVSVIDEKVKDYEARRKTAVLQKIKEYFGEAAEKLPEEIREKAFSKIYTDKWLNATAKVSEWKSAIDTGVKLILDDLETIRTMTSDFVNEGIGRYKENLILNEAIQYMNSLQHQKQLAEEKLAQQQREREERERKEAELKKEEPQGKEVNAPQGSNQQETVANEEKPASNQGNAAVSQNEAQTGYLIRVFKKEDAIEVIKYCKFNEFGYEVVKE